VAKNGGQLRRRNRNNRSPSCVQAFPDTQIRRPIMYLGFIKDADDVPVCFDNNEYCTVNFIGSLLRKKLRANAI